MQTELTDLKVDWVSLVDRAAVRDPVNRSDPMRFLVWKRDDQTPEGGAHMKTAEELQAELTKAQETIAKAEADGTTLKADLAKALADIADLKRQLDEDREPAKKAEEINKDELPAPVRAALEKAETDAKANAERAEKAEKAAGEASEIAKAEREQRLTKEFVAKAEGYKALVVKADEFGPVLKEAAEKLSKESFEAIETVLKAADEQIAKGDLFKEQGRSREGQPDGALAEATKKADEIRKADPKLSPSQALDMALTADRGLQERYLAEVRR